MLATLAVVVTTCNLIWQSGEYTFDGPEPCAAASDCPGSDVGCVRRGCTDGVCDLALVGADTRLPDGEQTLGDCRSVICDGQGNPLDATDDADVPIDDLECTDDVCSDGAPSNPPTALGTPCEGGAKVCDGNGYCTPANCINGELDGDETDIDCGGSCGPCGGGMMCHRPTDCQSGVCIDGHCKYPTCIDGVTNGDETDVDCGGDTCPGCADGDDCLEPGDCDSGVCDGGLCQMPVCNDGVENGTETDVDCGGGCSGCPNGDACLVGGDCQSGICALNKCVPGSCNDMMLSPGESDVDCGGTQCARCPDGDACTTGTDCVNGICTMNVCASPGCGDNVQNGDETGVDCGGSCSPCPVGEGCMLDGDCNTTVCLNGSCALVNGCNPLTAQDHTSESQVTVSFQGGGNVYTPACIRISAGTTVDFVGNFAPHPLEGGKVIQSVIDYDPSSPFSPATTSGSSKAFVMPNVGLFPYYCITHAGGGMFGAVWVE
jgi:plastocyanin